MEISILKTEQFSKDYWQRIAEVITPERVAWCIVVFGITLRATQYLFRASLHIDEGALALNIINRSFAGLLQPLDSEQAAPVGFLFLEKLALLAFGDGEYSLRLIPFLSSIAAVFLFYEAARRCLEAWVATIAVAFFAVSSYVIYYGAQIKQYSSDIAITLLIVIAGFHLEARDLTARRAALFAGLGAVAVWLSHPSVLVLAGVATGLGLAALRHKDWRRFWKLAAVFAVWIMSFITFYLVSLRNLSGNLTLETSWAAKGAFMPLPPRSLADLTWLPGALIKMFTNPFGLPFPVLALVVFLIGGFSLFLKNKRQLLILIAPILFTLLASGAHKYPFGRRLLLFLIPPVLLMVAAGAEYIIEKKRPYSVLIGGALVALLLFQPVGGATRNMLHPRAAQDIRPILEYVRDRRKPGDAVYVYHHQRESFQYYAKKYGFDENECVMGVDARDKINRRANWEAYGKDLDKLRGNRRVWLLFSHVRKIKGVSEEEFMTQYLDRFGVRLERFGRSGASAYLYDLSTAPSPERQSDSAPSR
ncbi:MAG TPA: glycosyltransferase family 39 protein [Blastocatellia bacterium]|nr:glycosyltransferase family 39 protein [Blastocatellia bacterium]